MSKALEHSPIRHSKTGPLLGIFADVRCGLLRGEQIVLVTLFGTTVIVRGQNIDLSQLGDDLFRFVDPLGISVLLR